MTAWAISFGWNWLLVPVAIWFAVRAYRAYTQPWLKCVTVSFVTRESGRNGKKDLCAFVTLRRQERLPPWRLLEEVYVVAREERYTYLDNEIMVLRESDGHAFDRRSEIGMAVQGMADACKLRNLETEELTRTEARAAN